VLARTYPASLLRGAPAQFDFYKYRQTVSMSIAMEFTVSENHLKFYKFLNEFNMNHATLGYQTFIKNLKSDSLSLF